MQNCLNVKIGKEDCCFRTTAETVSSNQILNLVNFPPQPKNGDTHIVNFADALVVYEFLGQWFIKIVHKNNNQYFVVAEDVFDSENPENNWAHPIAIEKDTVIVKFTDDVLGYYIYENDLWSLKFTS